MHDDAATERILKTGCAAAHAIESWFVSMDGRIHSAFGTLRYVELPSRVRVESRGVDIPPNNYYFDITENEDRREAASESNGSELLVDKRIYCFALDISSMDELKAKAESAENGGEVHGDINIPIKLKPALIPVERGSKQLRQLTLFDIAVLSEASKAEESGELDLARSILVDFYGEHRSNREASKQKALIKPREYYLGTSKVTDTVMHMEDKNGEPIPYGTDFGVRVSGRNEQDVIVSLSVGDEDALEMYGAFSWFDRSVYYTVVTLWVANNRVLSLRQIAQSVAGSNAKPSKEMMGRVSKSMFRLLFMPIKLDYTDELRGRVMSDDGSPIVSAEKVGTALKGSIERGISANGKETVLYILSDEKPMLYEHDEVMGHLTGVKPKVMRAVNASARQHNERFVLMREYLISRVASAKNPKSRMSDRILFKTLYEHIGISEADATVKRRAREQATAILEAMENTGHIKGFSEGKSGSGRYNNCFDLDVKKARTRASKAK